MAEEFGAFEPPPPPPSFADRVLAAATAEPRRKKRLWPYVAAVAAAALVAAAVWPRGVQAGSLDATARTTVHAGRATLVVEPGAHVNWQKNRVEQDAGDVFYRIDPGASRFVVATPAGEVSVLGTCFRVEVVPMKPSTAAVVSAAVTATVLVTVYEGKVRLANAHGAREAAAGEKVVASTSSAPAPAPSTPSKVQVAVSEAPPPPAQATRDELLARDASQRAEIARLSAQVKALQGELGQAGPDGPLPAKKFLDLSHDELVELANKCTLQYDAPPLAADAPVNMGPDDAQAAGLSSADLAALQQATTEFDAKVLAELRALYIATTGDAAGADQLDARALETEIEAKSSHDATQAGYRDVARERAGLQPVPTDTSNEPPVERLARLMDNLGDDYEKAVAQAIGPDKAHALRALHGGWGMRSIDSPGCPGDR